MNRTELPDDPLVHLLRTDDRVAEVDALADLLAGLGGGRVGLRGLLGDLGRRARAVRVPAPAAVRGFRPDREDVASEQWWPQGITTSADAGDPDELAGREVVVNSAYAHDVGGVGHGARLTFTDVSDPASLRYAHVLLVEPFFHPDGALDLRPVPLHAGGIVWHGGHVHVAGTQRGLSSFRLDDVLRVPAGDAGRIGVRAGRVDTFGYRYVLPVRFTYDAGHREGGHPLRYSFCSLDRSTTPHQLVAGEYGRDPMTTRLVRYPLDPGTDLLHTVGGRAVPLELEEGVFGMQGAAVVDGRWYVTTSRGRFRLGSLWTGRPGDLKEHRWQLPVGPEDITYWPRYDELWSLSEYPWARYVYAMPRRRFDA